MPSTQATIWTIPSYSVAFLLYATIYRLAVLVVGASCIFWGYRLFLLAYRRGDVAGNAEITGKAGTFELTFRNAAPGSCFALFGAIIVGLLVWRLPAPSLDVRPTKEGVRVKTRGGGDHALANPPTPAAEEPPPVPDQVGRDIDRYREDLQRSGFAPKEAAVALNHLAQIARARRLLLEADAMASAAVAFDSNNANVLSTWAEISLDRRKFDDALVLAQRAAQVDNTFKEFQRQLVEKVNAQRPAGQ